MLTSISFTFLFTIYNPVLRVQNNGLSKITYILNSSLSHFLAQTFRFPTPFSHKYTRITFSRSHRTRNLHQKSMKLSAHEITNIYVHSFFYFQDSHSSEMQSREFTHEHSLLDGEPTPAVFRARGGVSVESARSPRFRNVPR